MGVFKIKVYNAKQTDFIMKDVPVCAVVELNKLM